MTRLFNEPAAFADEMIEGFVASHGRWVRRVSGGVARSTKSTPGTVALVIGGGSGHYPAFAGLVGQGLTRPGGGPPHHGWRGTPPTTPTKKKKRQKKRNKQNNKK
jgi:hypothetical protein